MICKVLEIIIRIQVFSFLDQKGCLNSTEHGFRPGRSCLSALVDVFDNIMHMLDSDSSVDMVYLDFSKASLNEIIFLMRYSQPERQLTACSK